MQRTGKILIAILLTLGIASAATAVGKHRFGSSEKRAKHAVNYISDELNLDSTQHQALSVFKDHLITSRKNFHKEMDQLHQDANTVLTADVFDRARALELVDSRTAMINAAAPELVSALGDFLDSLNPEQKTKVSDFIEKRIQHKRHRH